MGLKENKKWGNGYSIYISDMIIVLNKRENGNGLTEMYKRRD